MTRTGSVVQCEEELPTIRLSGATRRAALPSVEKMVAVRRRPTVTELESSDLEEVGESCSRVRVSPVATFPKRPSVLAPPPLAPRSSLPPLAPPPPRASRTSELASTPVCPVRPVSVPDLPALAPKVVAAEPEVVAGELDIVVDESDFRSPLGNAVAALARRRRAVLFALFLVCALGALAVTARSSGWLRALGTRVVAR